MIDHQKRKHLIEADSEMSQILGLSHEDITITVKHILKDLVMINTLKDLVEQGKKMY